MIRFDGVTVTYEQATAPAIADVSLVVAEGELCLVAGPTGSGKSTLLGTVNGLVPWFTGGRLDGRVTVAGRDTSAHRPRDLADVVGVVGQNPAARFVAATVEDEIAYTMENLGVAPDVMRRRVEEAVDLLGLHAVRRRAVTTLSSGEQQRVAIASVLVTTPQVLVLDEPTSALDPGAAEDVLGALTRLVHDLGLTLIVAEHRLERVVQYADRVVTVEAGRVADGAPAAMMARSPVVPPVVELGRLAGWSPLPLSVRDARRAAAEWRTTLPAPPAPAAPHSRGERLADVAGLDARYGPVTALRGVDLDVHRGEVVALMGRNGAGKSTLLRHLAGLARPVAGRALVGGDAPAALAPKTLVRRVALVPADPAQVLYASSVDEECAAADRDADLPAGTTAAAVECVLGRIDGSAHPRDLSEGQRLGLALG
ncbi:MAG TPA: ABC transporter ATP-binding protein, partial [Acidimicrobiia bacterium]|nr:ABC transporter ATP-binding protein [Acidimicrobiia bacterium]